MNQYQLRCDPDPTAANGQMHLQRDGDVAVLHAGPDFTVAQYTTNQMALLATLGHTARLDIDLSRVVDIDTDGVQWLIMAKRLAIAHDCAFRLRAPAAGVLELLTVCGLMLYFDDAAPARAPDRANCAMADQR